MHSNFLQVADRSNFTTLTAKDFRSSISTASLLQSTTMYSKK